MLDKEPAETPRCVAGFLLLVFSSFDPSSRFTACMFIVRLFLCIRMQRLLANGLLEPTCTTIVMQGTLRARVSRIVERVHIRFGGGG